MSPDERFESLVDELARVPGVTPPGSGKGFGSSALRFEGRIFAMLVQGALVVKVPRGRVDVFVGRGDGTRFDANKGTLMKEWLRLDPASAVPWAALAREALAFVGGPSTS